jgi:ribosomal protein S18 acetylase RimI-like enzyme
LTDDTLTIVSAASVSLEAYAAAFTESFQDYHHPVALDAAALARRVRLEQYDLENSLLALDGGEAVGVAALAVRGERGWVAGLAVVPGRRGRGLGRALTSAVVARARGCGLRLLSLDVLAVNHSARRLYERSGMSVARDLLVFERPADYAACGGGGAARRPALGEAPAAELLEGHFARLHSARPAWQREPSSLLAANLRGLHLGPRRRPRAYSLVVHNRDGNTYLADLAAADAAQADALCAALSAVPGPLRVVNEPEQSLFVAALRAHGFKEVLRQHEMVMEL